MSFQRVLVVNGDGSVNTPLPVRLGGGIDFTEITNEIRRTNSILQQFANDQKTDNQILLDRQEEQHLAIKAILDTIKSDQVLATEFERLMASNRDRLNVLVDNQVRRNDFTSWMTSLREYLIKIDDNTANTGGGLKDYLETQFLLVFQNFIQMSQALSGLNSSTQILRDMESSLDDSIPYDVALTVPMKSGPDPTAHGHVVPKLSGLNKFSILKNFFQAPSLVKAMCYEQSKNNDILRGGLVWTPAGESRQIASTGEFTDSFRQS